MTKLIAPHEGKEVQMVLAGTKPFAVIERRKDPTGFHLAIAQGDLLDTRVVGNGEIAFCLPKNSNLHARYKLLMSSRASMMVPSLEEQQRMMGKLFGYSDEAIEEFIKTNTCQCAKCTGAK